MRTSAGFRLDGVQPDGCAWTREAEIVVNCLWEGRLALDHQLGVIPRRKWVYRLKYRLLGELSRNLIGLPSFTMVLGSVWRYRRLSVSTGLHVLVSRLHEGVVHHPHASASLGKRLQWRGR